MQEQLADQQKECVELGAELAAAQKHGHELDCSLRAMAAEKVLSLSCTRDAVPGFVQTDFLSMPRRDRD